MAKIIKIGSWDKAGMPTGWVIEVMEGEKIGIGGYLKGIGGYCLGIDELFQGSVDVNGVEIVEWTEERRKAKEK